MTPEEIKQTEDLVGRWLCMGCIVILALAVTVRYVLAILRIRGYENLDPMDK